MERYIATKVENDEFGVWFSYIKESEIEGLHCYFNKQRYHYAIISGKQYPISEKTYNYLRDKIEVFDLDKKQEEKQEK